MLGKCGYVYQSCNFYYAGYFLTDMYMKDGVKIHPRQTRALFRISDNDHRKTIRPTLEQMNELNIQQYKGKQYKYLTFLCSKTRRKKLIKETLLELSFNYPKENDLAWKIRNKNGKWVDAEKPPYRTDMNNEYYEMDHNFAKKKVEYISLF